MRRIGVLDSGVGGLTVARALKQVLPNEGFIYAGDTARAPYGGHSPETLLAYSREIVQFFVRKNVKAVVLACGTSASTAFEALCAEFPTLPFIDVLRPSVSEIIRRAAQKPNLRIGFIATAATVKRGLFVQWVRDACPQISIEARACPLFAPMAERGLFIGNITRWAAENYLADWRTKIDALVLGCTHYPLLSDVIADVLPNTVQIDLGESTANAVFSTLEANNLLNKTSEKPACTYYISGAPAAFNPLASKIMNEEINAKKTSWNTK
ncbi:MAG: glutamate racemase [Defluviitaleaceae bacterium]|nr:glutamate racemase [Defluviitaleaceae bacterium]MCL2273550.1 glutamate racemase [Defluviitaleaceae bacterium]